jgi:hypothetical protein
VGRGGTGCSHDFQFVDYERKIKMHDFNEDTWHTKSNQVIKDSNSPGVGQIDTMYYVKRYNGKNKQLPMYGA